jgi:hypothetical protein
MTDNGSARRMLAEYASAYAASIAKTVGITDVDEYLTAYRMIEYDVVDDAEPLDPWTEYRTDVAHLSEMLCHVAGKLSDGTVLDGDPDLFGGLLTTIGEALWGVVYDATKASTAPFSARNGRLTRQTGS